MTLSFDDYRIFEIRAKIDALLVYVEGMKAHNMHQDSTGCSNMYDEQAFVGYGQEIEALALEMKQIRENQIGRIVW